MPEQEPILADGSASTELFVSPFRRPASLLGWKSTEPSALEQGMMSRLVAPIGSALHSPLKKIDLNVHAAIGLNAVDSFELFPELGAIIPTQASITIKTISLLECPWRIKSCGVGSDYGLIRVCNFSTAHMPEYQCVSPRTRTRNSYNYTGTGTSATSTTSSSS